MGHSEIRESTKQSLLEKVATQNYKKYLVKLDIIKVRGFQDQGVKFDFPVTALIGANGSGKSSILGAAGCAYKQIRPSYFFPKSAIGDESMADWRVEYEIVDKCKNPKGILRRNSNFKRAKWNRSEVLDRHTQFFGIERTVPAGEKTKFAKLMRSTYNLQGQLSNINAEIATQTQHIFGRSVAAYQVAALPNDEFFVGDNDGVKYSEFHFGAGESSIIRMVTEIENAPDNSLILIEEIENGLHPVATRRMVEYLMDVAQRKGAQAIFTTHSDYALEPLPKEAVWSCVNGKVTQGKLSVEALRSVSGRVDKEVVIFVEDTFAQKWVESILRTHLKDAYEQVAVYPTSGDGNAVKFHREFIANPATNSNSLCVLDGDSATPEAPESNIIKLPGAQPELSVLENVISHLSTDIAILTVACQLSPEAQDKVSQVIDSVMASNRDPHLIFNQIGMKLGFIPEEVIRGAFLSRWVARNPEFVTALGNRVQELIDSASA